MRNRLLVLIIGAILAALTVFPAPVAAQCATDCQDCRIDFRCQQNKLIDPRYACEVYYCQDGRPTENPPTPGREQILRVNIFGIGLRLNSEKAVQQMISLGFSVFLGVVAIVAVINGVIAAFKRSTANKAEDAQKLMKSMQNSIVGFLIVGLSLLIVQLVASALGLGSVFSIVDFGNFLPENDDPQIQQTT
jgi:hypothetical protein